MNLTELFYQSALYNALFFCWLASAVSSTRILIRCERKVTSALVLSIVFGPIAFALAWIFESRYLKRLKISAKPRADHALNWISLLAMALVTTICIATFHSLFVASDALAQDSSEKLILHIAALISVLGVVGGVILAALTRRVAFFESAWCTFLLSAYFTTLGTWSSKVFTYGTSSTYFSTILLSASLIFIVFLTFGGSLGYLLFGEGRLNLRFGYERFIGTRFLMTKRGSDVVSLISVISVFAVMIACAGMIVVMSVMNGFTSNLREKILGASAHLMVLKYGNDFNEYHEVINKTRDISGVKGVTPFIVNEGMVSSKKNLSGAMVTGIDVAMAKESGRLINYVSEESIEHLLHPEKIKVSFTSENLSDQEEKINQLPGAIIGKEMALGLQVFVGDIVNIISPVGEMGPTGPIPKAKPFRVAGLFYSGMYEYDTKFVYIKLKDAQEFFNLSGSVTGVEYRVEDIENTRKLAAEIDKKIGGYPYYTRDWMQMNRPMFSALQLEKIAMLIILGTLIFMASLLILVTLVMVVMEKGKEIAILKSMGATDVSIMKIFVTYGLFVGGLGAFLGGMIGVSVCLLVEKVGIRLDPDVYYFSNLPIKIVSSEVYLVVLSAVLISFLATIPPSLFAARLKPVDGLRYE